VLSVALTILIKILTYFNGIEDATRAILDFVSDADT
jgi:hypothetical protein